MAAGNLSAGLMDPKTRALYANLLRRPNVTITQNTASAQRPSNIEGMRIQDQQRQMAQTRDALNTVDPGFGYYAPLAGVIKGIASNISRGQQEKTLDELYGQYAAAQQAERAQAAQAAEAARVQRLEDEQRKMELEDRLAREAEEQKQAAMGRREMEQLRYEIANRPASNTQADAIRQVLATTEEGSPEQRQALLIAGGGDIVKDQDARREKAASEARELDELTAIKADLERAKALQNASPSYTTGPFADFLPNVSKESQELNQLYTQLGLERLSNLKGSTSEKELDVVFRAGASMDQDTPANIAALDRQLDAVNSQISRLQGEDQIIDFNDLD